MFRTIGCLIKLVFILLLIIAAGIYILTEYKDEIFAAAQEKVETLVKDELNNELADVRNDLNKDTILKLAKSKIEQIKANDYDVAGALSKIKRNFAGYAEDKKISLAELEMFKEKLKEYGK